MLSQKLSAFETRIHHRTYPNLTHTNPLRWQLRTSGSVVQSHQQIRVMRRQDPPQVVSTWTISAHRASLAAVANQLLVLRVSSILPLR